jgi:hypothetical protein
MKTYVVRSLLALSACALVASAALAREPTQAQRTALAAAGAEIAASGYSAPRLLTLGRAQLAAGETGAAIASFERGRLLAPRSEPLRDALSEARAVAGVAAPPQGLVQRLTAWLSLREWSLIALVTACTATLSLLGLALARRRALWAAAFGATLVALGFAGVGALTAREALSRAVVVRPDASLQRSPIPSAERLRPVSEGELVTLTRQQHAGFVYVELAGGDQGWLDRSTVAPIAAPPARGS